MQHRHRRRPESVVARAAAREPASEGYSDRGKENAEMEKSRLWTRSPGCRRAVGDGGALYGRERRREAEREQY